MEGEKITIEAQEPGSVIRYYYEAEIHQTLAFLRSITSQEHVLLGPGIKVETSSKHSILGVCGRKLKRKVVAQWIDPDKQWLVFTQEDDFWTVRGRFKSKAALIFWEKARLS